MVTTQIKGIAHRKLVTRLTGERMQAVVIYNRTLMSSALSAQVLVTALKGATLHGEVHALPYYRYTTKDALTTGFKPQMHTYPVDLYLVGVEGWYEQLHDFLAFESVRSITLFPIAANDAKDFFMGIKEAREAGHLPKGVGLDMVCDATNNNLVDIVASWCCKHGMADIQDDEVFTPVDGYARFALGKNYTNKDHADNTELVEVYYKHALEASDMNATGSYRDLLEKSTKQLECLHLLMSNGFDDWVKAGLELVQKVQPELAGNLLLATISKEMVVFAPNTKDGAYVISYLLRKKFPNCRAIVLYHKHNYDNKYVYRVLRGVVAISGNIFTILAEATRDGKRQASISSELAPKTVQRIADAGMAAIIIQRQKGHK